MDKSLPHYHSSLIVKTFGIQNSGCLLRSKPQSEFQHVLEAIDPFKMAPTSMSSTYMVSYNLHVLWMCMWMSPYHATVILISQQRLDVNQNSGCLTRSKPQCSSDDIEGIDQFKMAHTSMSNTYKVNYNLYMLWMCPYHITIALIVITFRSQYLEFWLSSEENTTEQ